MANSKITPYDKNGNPITGNERREIVTIAVTGNGYIVFPDGRDEYGGRNTGVSMGWKNLYSFDNIESLIFFLRENLEEPKINFKQAVFDAVTKGEV